MKSRWFSPHALLLHLAMLVWVAGCALAAWWQVGRAAQGNNISYMYAIEWPVFAILGALGWWALLHTEQPSEEERVERKVFEEKMREAAQQARRESCEQEDPALSAYNDHLAQIAGHPKRKLWGH